MKVRVEVNGKKLAITMDSRTVMDLSLACRGGYLLPS